jgi:hypothetical protein
MGKEFVQINFDALSQSHAVMVVEEEEEEDIKDFSIFMKFRQ